MVQNRTRKIVITGVLGAISIVLGWTPLGFIPWFAGASLTIMHIPVIIGAILEGPVVGAVIGFIFGISSLVRATIPPVLPQDLLFTDPLISILPRLFIGPLSWLIYQLLKRLKVPVLPEIATGVFGSLTNSILVLGMIGLLGKAPWEVLFAIFLGNSLIEAAASAILVFAVVSIFKQVEKGGRKQGADI